MTCHHNHDQILEFLRKIFFKGFQIYQNYLCALRTTLFTHLSVRRVVRLMEVQQTQVHAPIL